MQPSGVYSLRAQDLGLVFTHPQSEAPRGERPDYTHLSKCFIVFSSCCALARIAPHLVAVDLPRNRTLRNPGVVEEDVYFLEDGMCSIVATMKNGMTIEVGVIGKEGFVDVPTLLSAGESPTRSFMQIAGHGFKVKAKILTEESEHPGPFRACLLRFAQGFARADCADRSVQSSS